MQTGSGNAFATATNPSAFDDNCAHLIGFSADHYIEGVVHRAVGYSPVDAHEIEWLLRADITPNFTRAYEVLADSGGGFQIVLWNGDRGDFTVLSPTGPGTGTIAHGDVIRAQIVGTTITVFKNDVQVATVDNSVLTSGNPGIGSFMRGNGNVLASFGWQSIEASDI